MFKGGRGIAESDVDDICYDGACGRHHASASAVKHYLSDCGAKYADGIEGTVDLG